MRIFLSGGNCRIVVLDNGFLIFFGKIFKSNGTNGKALIRYKRSIEHIIYNGK